MTAAISLKGIEGVIANLNYHNTKTLKYKLIHAIRKHYEDENSPASLKDISAAALIKDIWGTADNPEIINARRKNLSSIKSSVNADLKRLFKEGKNAEGVTIGRDNIFIMSDEAKDKLIATFLHTEKKDSTVDLEQITEGLNIVNEILSDPKTLAGVENSEGFNKLNQLKNITQSLAEKFGLEEKQLIDEPSGASEKLKTIGLQRAGNVLQGAGVQGEREEEIFVEVAGAEGAEETEVQEGFAAAEAGEELAEADVAAENAGAQEPEQPGTDVGQEDVVEEEVLVEVAGAEGAEEIEVQEGFAAAETGEELAEADVAAENAGAQEPEQLETDGGLGDDLEEEVFLEAEEEPEFKETESEAKFEDAARGEILEEEGGGELEGFGAGGNFDGQNIEEAAEGKNQNQRAGIFGSDFLDSEDQGQDKRQEAKVLAEEFESYLSISERFFNQHIMIKKGEYIIGSRDPQPHERPEQKAVLNSYYIGAFPVTNAFFEIFIAKTGYVTTAEKRGFGTVYSGRVQKIIDKKTGLVRFICNTTLSCSTVAGACWYQPNGPGSAPHLKRDHPVTQISLQDAIAFAAWTGKRLPTENEWEAAARGPCGNIFPWGNNWEKDCCNIEESYIADTTPVDKYIKCANDLGIVDTLGNVLEWTMDIWQSDFTEKKSTGYHVVKGGSWASANQVRLSSRFKMDAATCANVLGFRCVAD